MEVFGHKIKVRNVKYLLFPLFIFLGTFFVEPMYKIEANLPTIPFFQWFYVLLFVFLSPLNIKINKMNYAITSLLTLSLIYAILISGTTLVSKISFIGVVFFARLFSMLTDERNYYNKLLYFIVSYLSLSILVYIVRILMYDFDFYRVRGGMNIWGGGSLIIIIYLFIVVQILLKKPQKQIFIFSIVSLITSLLYMNRVAILTSVIIVIFQLFSVFKKHPVKLVVTMGLFFSFLIKEIVNSEFYTLLAHRYESVDLNKITKGISFIEEISYDRAVLWELSFEILKNNLMGIGVGSLKDYTNNYSSTHNLFLNNLVEAGIFFGVIINVIIIIPIFKIIGLRIKFQEKLLSILIYLSFLLNATMSGAKLIQTTGYTSSFLLLLVFFVFNSISYRKRIIT